MKKIEFFSSIDGVAETYPIVESRTEIPQWMRNAQQEFKQMKHYDFHIARCPGIIDVFTTGYIVKAWHDIAIKSTESGLETVVPAIELENLLEKPAVQVQGAQGVAKHIPKRPWSNKHILKINTPWHIISDCKFLMIPIPYTDQFEIESCIGVLDPSISSEINIQGYVNGLGEFTIKAGTPLAQLVPLSNSKYDFVVRDKNEKDTAWLKKRKFLNSISFNLSKAKINQAYRNFFNKSNN
jgi:hypothetical protein